MNAPTIVLREVEFVRKLVRDRSGIVLDESKGYLIEARLQPLARREGFRNYLEMVQRLMEGASPGLLDQVVAAMTTNETSFFRDKHPFDALREEVLPALIRSRASARRINIFCAAASSGQEPYSIALLVKEYFPCLEEWGVSILAADLSTEMLARCGEGVYSQLEINRGLPPILRAKYFSQKDGSWIVAESLRKMVTLQQLNLAAPWPALPSMDLVFLRNVLIYFSAETKKEILNRVFGVLRQDGYLFLGGTETISGMEGKFGRMQLGKATCYRPSGG